MSEALAGQESLSSAWTKFDGVGQCLRHYLETSEEEFSSLIRALDVCWNMAENVHKATAQLNEFTDDALSSQTAIIQDSLLDACAVFKAFLGQVQEARGQLGATARQTRELLGTAQQLEKNIAPLKHLAFHFRLEASRLSDQEGSFLEKACEGTKQVVSSVQQAGDSQQSAMLTILHKLSTATQLVEDTCSSYATKAAESEQKVARSLALLSSAPRDLLEVKSKANALGTTLTQSIGEAVKALQGHDAIRQRLEHILEGLAKLRDGKDQDETVEPAHALLLQRLQAASVMELIGKTGTLIKRELNTVIDCSRNIAGEGSTPGAGGGERAKFEEAVDHLASLSADVAGLLQGEAKIGHYVVSQIDPIREMLNANSRELEKVAGAMKLLALNVQCAASKIPSAKGVSVLGVWTANASEDILHLATHQNEQFSRLRAALEAQVGRMAADTKKVESCLDSFAAQKATDALRHARRKEYDSVGHLSLEASQLRNTTEALMQSLKFVDEGIGLLRCLDGTIDCLLAIYPKAEKPFDIDSASAGYTMQQQHDTHDLLFGNGAEASAPMGKPAEAQEYGDNIELF